MYVQEIYGRYYFVDYKLVMVYTFVPLCYVNYCIMLSGYII